MLDFLFGKGRKTVGLALGSGAGRGFAHIGVIKTLLRNNIPIDFISGSSIGAIVAAYYALTLDIDSLEKIALSINPKTILKLIDLNNPKQSLIKGNKIRNFLTENLFGEKTFSDTKIPLRIAATSLDDGLVYCYKEGKIIDAVIASGTIPGILPAINKDEKHLVDGGLADAIPLDLLSEFNPDILIGVDLYAYDSLKGKNYNTREVLNTTYKIYISKLSKFLEKEYKKNVLLIKPRTNDSLNALIFNNAAEKILIGEKETENMLPKIKSLL